MDNSVILDKSGFSLKSGNVDEVDNSVIWEFEGQNYIIRGTCGEGCDCGESDIDDESDIWDEMDESEFEDILLKARTFAKADM